MSDPKVMSVAEAVDQRQYPESEDIVTITGRLFVSTFGASIMDIDQERMAVHIPTSKIFNTIWRSNIDVPNEIIRIGTINMFIGLGSVTCRISNQALAPFFLTATDVSQFSIGTSTTNQTVFEDLLEQTTEFVVLHEHPEHPIIKRPGNPIVMVPVPIQDFTETYKTVKKRSSFPNHFPPQTKEDMAVRRLSSIQRYIDLHYGTDDAYAIDD